ncbi:MAG: AmmeMemoRadiSam system protein A [Desulfurococcaceae archaeon]
MVEPRELSDEDGALLVSIARRAIEEIVLNGSRYEPPREVRERFRRPGMTFTTIERIEGEGRYSLRGCIGFLAPVKSLIDSVIDSAIEAAINDPRFPRLEPWELDTVVIEVTVLSVPKPIPVAKRTELPSKVVIGLHGLVARRGFHQGTLLPSVPLEYCWDEETFLAETCVKAFMSPDCWLDPSVVIEAYEGIAFRELEPRGRVVRRNLAEEYARTCRASSVSPRPLAE